MQALDNLVGKRTAGPQRDVNFGADAHELTNYGPFSLRRKRFQLHASLDYALYRAGIRNAKFELDFVGAGRFEARDEFLSEDPIGMQNALLVAIAGYGIEAHHHFAQLGKEMDLVEAIVQARFDGFQVLQAGNREVEYVSTIARKQLWLRLVGLDPRSVIL